jgi:predicted metal-dependent hydrolase
MDITYTVLYSNRKTLGLTVERDKSIIVRSPWNATNQDIKDFIERKRYWIHTKLRHPQKYTRPRKIQFISGASILYLGKSYKLELVKNDQDKVILNKGFKISSKYKNKANEMFKEWYSQRALSKITPKTEYYAKNIGVSYNSLKISELKFRWGSCTPKKNLQFNWRIIKAPL